MANYASGRKALAISDRSGLQFPWNEMLTEWNGSFVHYSEYESKQPQLTPLPLKADAMALYKVRPARKAFSTPTILPNNPFTMANGSTTVTITQPNHNFKTGDAVRFREIPQQVIGGVSISTLELNNSLNGTITATDTSITLNDASAFPTSGYIYVQTKPTAEQTRAGENIFTLSEVIRYTSKVGNVLSGLTRGTSAPTYGVSPESTTARTHNNADIVFGSYSITILNITVPNPGMPSTKVVSNQYTIALTAAASSNEEGGGFPSFAGPVGDRP